MSPRGGGGLDPLGARAREEPMVGRDGSGGSRKRKKEMPGGLRRLRHVIRPDRTRAFPACAPPLGLHFPSPPAGLAAGLERWRGRFGPPPAHKRCLPGSRRVVCSAARGCSTWPPSQPFMGDATRTSPLSDI